MVAHKILMRFWKYKQMPYPLLWYIRNKGVLLKYCSRMLIKIVKGGNIYWEMNKPNLVKDKPFLHDRPWISLWIKSISNQLDITVHMIASQLSRYYDIISNGLWRHQQNEDRASETQAWCVTIVVFIVIYGFVMSWNKIKYVLSWQTVSALTRVFFFVYFPRCFATREINTKITLLWALKQFVTRVRTLFSIYSVCHVQSIQ